MCKYIKFEGDITPRPETFSSTATIVALMEQNREVVSFSTPRIENAPDWHILTFLQHTSIMTLFK